MSVKVEQRTLVLYISSTPPWTQQNTNKHHFKNHFPGKPRLAGCSFDSQPPVILILSILVEQAKTLRTHMELCTLPRSLTLSTISTSFEATMKTAEWRKVQTLIVSSIDRNLRESPMSIQLLTQGNCSFTASSTGTGATFSPPAVISSSEPDTTMLITFKALNKN